MAVALTAAEYRECRHRARLEIAARAETEFERNAHHKLATFLAENDGGEAAALAVSLCFRALMQNDKEALPRARAALIDIYQSFRDQRIDTLADEIDTLAANYAQDLLEPQGDDE